MKCWRRRCALAALIVLAACTALRPPDDDSALRVMTFNIRLNIASDEDNAWPHRKDAVASMIRFHGADLVGVQEALPEQLQDLDTLLPQFARFGAGRSADRSGEHSAIFYRKTRFELLRHDTFWLSETPSVAGSKGWDAAYERIVTWGELRDRRSRRTLFLFNTHLDHIGVVARREGTQLLLQRVADIAGEEAPVIVTGDFNAPPESEPYRLVEASGFRDAFVASRCPHHGPTSTWNGFQQIEPERRIDFIFVHNAVDVLQHAILSDTFDGRFPSDHLPVIAEMRIGSPTGRRLPCE